MLGKLTWAAIPLSEPIPLFASGLVIVGIVTLQIPDTDPNAGGGVYAA